LLSPATNLYLTDTFCQDVPLRVHAANTIREGYLPDWTSLVHCGWPIFADSQTGIFYPFFSLYVIDPTPEMHDVFMAVHFYFAAIFMYAFLIHQNLSPLAAVCGAVTFMGGSYFQSTHIVPGVLAVGCWLPLALLLIDRAAAGYKTSLWWLALVNSSMILAGHMQVALICFTLEAIYMPFRFGIRNLRSLINGYVLTFLLPVMISSIQVVPTFWYSQESTRMEGGSTGLSWETYIDYAVQPGHFWTFLWPDYFGSPEHYKFPNDPYDAWEETLVVFQGFAAILLLPLGMLFGKPRRDGVFWTLLLALILAISTASPIYSILYHLPVYNWFRWPARYMLLASFACAVLVARGACVLSNWLQSRWEIRPTASLSILVVLTTLGLYRTMAYYTTSADFYSLHSPTILAEKKHAQHFRLLPICRALYGYWTANEAQLRKNATFLPVSYNMLFGVGAAPLLDQGNAVTPRNMHDVLSCKSANALRIAAVTHLSAPESPEHLIEIEKYLYSVPLPPPDDLEVLSNDPCYVAKFRRALPRAWMVYRTELIEKREDRLARIDSSDFDPAQAAIVEVPDLPAFTPPSTPSTVTWEEPSPGELLVKATTETDGLLIVADNHHPDFSVTIDGQEAELLRVNHAFRGVVLPKGTHVVHISYQVAAFRFGIVLSVIGLLIVTRGIWKTRFDRSTVSSAQPRTNNGETKVP
jgi:hypothetical protein